jgi:hypothetical protein
LSTEEEIFKLVEAQTQQVNRSFTIL